MCLTCRQDGRILSCSAQGHSEYAPAGSDIVCAAVTILLRTTLQVLLEYCPAAVDADLSERGRMFFCVKEEVGNDVPLVYAADFLRSGLKSLCKEYPRHIAFREEIKD